MCFSILLASEYGGTGKSHRTRKFQDIRARKARGCDLAFDNFETVVMEGSLPEGGIDRVACRIAAIVPLIVMKGKAMADRPALSAAFVADGSSP